MMARDLTQLLKTLEADLRLKGALKEFRPVFELVGSMAEGTRIGLANECDISLKFDAWRDAVPFRVDRDPSSLKKAASCPPMMEKFFDGEEFNFHEFMFFLLKAVEKAVGDIFDQKRNPPNLRRATTNRDWRRGETRCRGKCKTTMRAHNMEQCELCAVTVSQTKRGVALQFEWQTQVFSVN